jgi:hypothetical protein
MTHSSLILALTAGIVVVDLIASGLILNLGGVWWRAFWTGIIDHAHAATWAAGLVALA